MPEQVHAAHILVDSEKEADMIMEKLEDDEDFETLAMKYSKCPSKEEGGDLGWFARGAMVKEFEDAAFSAKPGQVVKVKSEFGWHVIKMLGTRDSDE